MTDDGEAGIDCDGNCLPCHCTLSVTTSPMAEHQKQGQEFKITKSGDIMATTLNLEKVGSTCNNNGVMDDGESGVDCDGVCPPCSCTTWVDNGYCNNNARDSAEDFVCD